MAPIQNININVSLCSFLIMMHLACKSPNTSIPSNPESKLKDTSLLNHMASKDLITGNGYEVEEGDDVLIEETVTYRDGTLIFSTDQIGQPLKIKVGADQIIEGLDQGIRGMKEGGERMLVIPPHLSKRTVYPDNLSPDSILVVRVKVIKVLKNQK